MGLTISGPYLMSNIAGIKSVYDSLPNIKVSGSNVFIIPNGDLGTCYVGVNILP